jgi:hypothetical protein
MSEKLPKPSRKTVDTLNAQIHDRSRSCLSTCTSIGSAGAKIVQWTQKLQEGEANQINKNKRIQNTNCHKAICLSRYSKRIGLV